MSSAASPLVVADTPVPEVRVGRFARPDLMPELHDAGKIQDTSLYRAVRAEVLDGRPAGGAVVLNFGLVVMFSSHFFRLLIEVNNEVKAGGGRLLLCGLTGNARKGYDIMGGERTFPGQLRESESQAVYDAKQP